MYMLNCLLQMYLYIRIERTYKKTHEISSTFVYLLIHMYSSIGRIILKSPQYVFHHHRQYHHYHRHYYHEAQALSSSSAYNLQRKILYPSVAFSEHNISSRQQLKALASAYRQRVYCCGAIQAAQVQPNLLCYMNELALAEPAIYTAHPYICDSQLK